MSSPKSVSRKVFSFLTALFFTFSCIPLQVFAQAPALPAPGQLLAPSQAYSFPVLKAIKLDPQHPLDIEFIVDTGKQGRIDKAEADRLINYFLAGLTIPESELWVNLSPFEQDRVTTPALGQTDLGKDMLGQDYILKQMAASLTHPDSPTGQDYWKKVQAQVIRAGADSFSKVWIMPDHATIYEHKDMAIIAEAKLKVMLEQDCLAASKAYSVQRIADSKGKDGSPLYAKRDTLSASSASQAMRETILPQINKEVNEGENFAALRQIHNSLLLAVWFKEKFKQSFYRDYINKGNIKGIDLNDKNAKQKVYDLYVQAFTKGLYNVVRKEKSGAQTVYRKYFSGGLNEATLGITSAKIVVDERTAAGTPRGGPLVSLGTTSDPNAREITAGTSIQPSLPADSGGRGEGAAVLNRDIAEQASEVFTWNGSPVEPGRTVFPSTDRIIARTLPRDSVNVLGIIELTGLGDNNRPAVRITYDLGMRQLTIAPKSGEPIIFYNIDTPSFVYGAQTLEIVVPQNRIDRMDQNKRTLMPIPGLNVNLVAQPLDRNQLWDRFRGIRVWSESLGKNGGDQPLLLLTKGAMQAYAAGKIVSVPIGKATADISFYSDLGNTPRFNVDVRGDKTENFKLDVPVLQPSLPADSGGRGEGATAAVLQANAADAQEFALARFTEKLRDSSGNAQKTEEMLEEALSLWKTDNDLARKKLAIIAQNRGFIGYIQGRVQSNKIELAGETGLLDLAFRLKVKEYATLLTIESNEVRQARLEQDFTDYFGEEARTLTKASARLEIEGGHIDYPDFFMYINPKNPDDWKVPHNYNIAMALDQFNVMAAAKRNNLGKIRAKFVDYGTTLEIDLRDLPKYGDEDACLKLKEKYKDNMPAMFLLGVIQAAIDEGFNIEGADFVIQGNVPLASGLSSSAATDVSVALACSQMFGWGLEKQDDVTKFKLAMFARKAELSPLTGSSCGYLDQLTVVFGKKDHMVVLDYGGVPYIYAKLAALEKKKKDGAPITDADQINQDDIARLVIGYVPTSALTSRGYEFVVVHGGVKRSGETLGTTKYVTRARVETPLAGAILARLVGPAELTHTGFYDIAQLEGAKDAWPKDPASQIAYKRALHQLGQKERTLEFGDALRNGRIDDAKRIFSKSGWSLSMKGPFEITALVDMGAVTLWDLGWLAKYGVDPQKLFGQLIATERLDPKTRTVLKTDCQDLEGYSGAVKLKISAILETRLLLAGQVLDNNLDDLRDALLAHGFAARLTGGGGGGCVEAITETPNNNQVTRETVVRETFLNGSSHHFPRFLASVTASAGPEILIAYTAGPTTAINSGKTRQRSAPLSMFGSEGNLAAAQQAGIVPFTGASFMANDLFDPESPLFYSGASLPADSGGRGEGPANIGGVTYKGLSSTTEKIGVAEDLLPANSAGISPELFSNGFRLKIVSMDAVNNLL